MASVSVLRGVAGASSVSSSESTVALGDSATAFAAYAISIGNSSAASGSGSIAFGSLAKATVSGGVALGSKSSASVSAGVVGYNPFINAASTETSATWKSGYAVVSIGLSLVGRQLTNLAAATEDMDTVNVAQLKAVRNYVAQGWNVSANGADLK